MKKIKNSISYLIKKELKCRFDFKNNFKIMWKDRNEAGHELALKLLKHKFNNAVIYALPRGGLVLGGEINKELKVPLDILIIRKLGHPFNPEYAIGAVALDGHTIFNDTERFSIGKEKLEEIIEAEKKEANRRKIEYLGERKQISAKGKTAILVDDGIATGLSMLLAIQELKHQNPKKIIVAVPVSPKDVAEEIKKHVDELVTLLIPDYYIGSVGGYYQYFPQVEDDEVIRILNESY